MNEKNQNYNFDAALSSVDQIKRMKSKNETKQSTSIKPLKFDLDPEDSALKTKLIEKINSKNLTYADLHEYCTGIMNGDILAGKNLGYNIITGLRKRHTMTDVTLHMLCDFINVDIVFEDRDGSGVGEE